MKQVGLIRSLCMIASLGLCTYVHAGSTYHFEPQSTVSGQPMSALGDNLFGDSISYVDGGVNFQVTDVSAKTSVQIPLTFGRRLTPPRAGGGGSTFSGSTDITKDTLGEFWTPDLPVISGIYPTNDGFVTGAKARCSSGNLSPAAIPLYPYNNGPPLMPYNFWYGVQATLPGRGEEKLLSLNSGTTVPADGLTYKYVTASNLRVSCLTALKNGVGEGFLVSLPDGSKYYFDWMATRAEPSMDIPYNSSYGTWIYRETVFFFPTKAVDRFGQTITYAYDAQNPTHLTSMTASDGAKISINYDANGRVSTVATGNQTWTYVYTADPYWTTNVYLSTVKLPDLSTWQYAYANNILGLDAGPNSFGEYCHYDPGYMTSTGTPPASGVGSLKITHPSGAVGLFQFKAIVHGNNNVTQGSCYPSVQYGSGRPKAYPLSSLISKSISGLGLTTKTWSLTYAPSWSWDTECSAGCPNTSQTTVTSSDGKIDTYVFGSDFQSNSNQLLSHSIADSSGVKQTVANTYLTSAVGQPFPDYIGGTLGDEVSYSLDNPLVRRNRPVVDVKVTQDGVNFVSHVNQFDAFVRPLDQTKSSSLGSKTETTAYFDNLAKWIIGQVQSVTCTAPSSCANLVETQTDYDAATALPLRNYAFGKLLQSLTYNADGTVATVTDGNSNVTTLSGWKRGIPQTIHYPATTESPNGAFKTAVVDDNGWVTSATDENGYATCFGHDAMGRVNKITYPSETQVGVCDSSVWTPTSITFSSGNAAAYGVPAGHWRQTTLTGNGRHVQILDALWRPIVDQTLDLGNVSGTTSEVIKRYDASGRLTFQSYPMNTAGTAVYTDTTLKGTHTTYDGLDRVTQVDQDSELGVLSTRMAYLSGFKTEVTSPRGFKTASLYMAYDQPTTDWPVTTTLPEGVIVNISRDVFGKPLRILRRNADNSEWVPRYLAYDDNQQLCKRTDFETGTTVMDYDDAGNLAWSAAGRPWSPTTACPDDRTGAYASGRRVDRSYDARNRLTSLVFPTSVGNILVDGAGNQSWAYTPDGLPASITTANTTGGSGVKNSYTYNRRRLLIAESQWQAGFNTTPSVGYGYDANGNLASNDYPDGLSVDYAPNALGQVTKVASATATYAYGAKYYPNGALKSFTYGNGIGHSMLQNTRGLPDRSQDVYGTSNFLDDSYDYDADGNVAAISDGLSGARGNRTMTYDGLNRLTDVTSPMYGASGAHYTYDTRDNLVTVIAPGRNQSYYYPKAARGDLLTNVVDNNTGASVIGLDYDLQGNLSNKNGLHYLFDFGNRLRQADTTNAGVETYRYDAFGRRSLATSSTLGHIVSQYGNDGRLLYQNNLRVGKTSSYMYLSGSLVAELDLNTGTGVYSNRYIHTDALGSPVRVTNGPQAIQEYNEYEPYGLLLNRPVTDGPGYTGHVSDASTGLDYMQQRYYDPGIGRFLSVDPVTANPGTGANFNRYWYANNNPYKFTDPDGRVVKLVGNDEYVKQVSGQIAQGKRIDPGFRSRLEQLESSKYVHTISDANGSDNPNAPFNASASDGTNESNGVGEGTSIYYDPTNSTQSNGNVRPPLVGLAHEVSHSSEADSGTKSRTKESNGQTKTENNAARAAGSMLDSMRKDAPTKVPNSSPAK